MILIAECGSNHFGSMEKAKELILAAADSGAHLVKFQAYEAKDVAAHGSMPPEFYEQCALTLEQYKDLIHFGREKGITVFCSVFSENLANLQYLQRWQKISGRQLVEAHSKNAYADRPNSFVSFPKSHLMHAASLRNAIPLYVSPYLVVDPELFLLEYLSRILLRKPFGYSDHTCGIVACELAAKAYGARVIEKHFTIEKDMKFKGQVFRDTVHGATPKEFRQLANLLKV